MEYLPVTEQQLVEIKRAQAADNVCCQVPEFSLSGWPDQCFLSEAVKIHDGHQGLPSAEGKLESPSGGQELQEIWRFSYTTPKDVSKQKKIDHNL